MICRTALIDSNHHPALDIQERAMQWRAGNKGWLVTSPIYYVTLFIAVFFLFYVYRVYYNRWPVEWFRFGLGK